MKTILLFLIRAYQALLSPLFYGSCRFHPSCSHYAAEAVEMHGPVKGAWLALGRLLRCQPFCRGGFDPVPEEFSIVRREFKSFSFDLCNSSHYAGETANRIQIVNSGLKPRDGASTVSPQGRDSIRTYGANHTTKQRAGRSPTPQSGDNT